MSSSEPFHELVDPLSRPPLPIRIGRRPIARQKQRTEGLRDRILESAVALIAADGVSGFTTSRVVEKASTSIPAIYELFGDKSGLVREIFFEGFRLLRSCFDALETSDDPRVRARRLYRPSDVSIGEPGPCSSYVLPTVPGLRSGTDEKEAGRSVREHIIGTRASSHRCRSSRRQSSRYLPCVLALAQGMAAVEVAGWLGTRRPPSRVVGRSLIDAVFDGLRPNSRASDG